MKMWKTTATEFPRVQTGDIVDDRQMRSALHYEILTGLGINIHDNAKLKYH